MSYHLICNTQLQWGPIRTISPTFAEIQTTVNESDKQRFALRPNPATNPALDANTTDPAHWMIRANQGHSIKLESEGLLQPFILPSEDPTATAAPAGVPVPPTVVHGTYFCFWPAIVASGGLKPMGRNHVHCSTGLPPTAGRGGDDSGGASEVVSGMRRDAELLVYVDVERSMREAGLKWWKSDNGVVLTEGDENGLVPARFFREVVGRKQEVVGVLWKYGEKVADLPDELNMKVPKGKRRVTGSGNRGGVGGSGSRGRSKGIFRDGSRKHMES